MPRKRKVNTDDLTALAATATTETPNQPPMPRPDWVDGTPVDKDGSFIRESSPSPTPQMQLQDAAQTASVESNDQIPKNWGDPYKSVFSCPEVGFELGENRRFKQRIFKFADRPDDEVVAELKANGFTYRSPEKAWTVNANPDTRKLSDELARKWAGPNYIQRVER